MTDDTKNETPPGRRWKVWGYICVIFALVVILGTVRSDRARPNDPAEAAGALFVDIACPGSLFVGAAVCWVMYRRARKRD